MSDDELEMGLSFGFEASDRPKEMPLVYWMDGGRTIRVRPSRGRSITRAWQTPRDRELIRQHIQWLNAEGFIDHDESFAIWNAVCNMVADRLEVIEEIESETESQSADLGMIALGICAAVCFGALAWMAFDMWGWR